MCSSDLGDLGRASPSLARGRGVTGGRGRRQGLVCASLPPPSLYRAPRGAPALGDGISKEGRRPRGTCPPSQVGRPPPLGFPTLGAGGGPWGRTSPPGAVSPPTSANGALRDRWPHPVDPRDLPVVSVQYRVTPKLSRWPKLDFLYINLHLWTIRELLVTYGISSGTPNNFWVTAY